MIRGRQLSADALRRAAEPVRPDDPQCGGGDNRVQMRCAELRSLYDLMIPDAEGRMTES